MEYADNGDVF
jgi:serine/threonine protein kinase